MEYHFRNLVFEGGGVKGMAYVGAMDVLEQKGILEDITRVGGTSAGAINACLFALGFDNEATKKELFELNFNNFKDDTPGFFRDSYRFLKKFGWYKGDYFHNWIAERVEAKLGSPNATFADLRAANRPELFVYGTNLSTSFGKIWSAEDTPDEPIAAAVRKSMSIPLFFKAVRDDSGDVYVDGGVLNNYPVKLFDRHSFVHSGKHEKMCVHKTYYDSANENEDDMHVYNKETLGLRLDSREEISVFRDRGEPHHRDIRKFKGYLMALVGTVLAAQGNQHLHTDDWHRTVYIDTLDVKTTDFDITKEQKEALFESGIKGAKKYFDDWFDKPECSPKNRIDTD